MFLVGTVGTFGLNFPIVLTAMAKTAFHGTASTYGLFNIILAVGSSAGALLAGPGAGQGSAPSWPRRPGSAAPAVAAVMPDMMAFLALIAAMGLVNLVFQAMANASVQLAVDPRLRAG